MPRESRTLWLAVLLLPLFLIACGDLPTRPVEHGRPLLSGECIPDGSGIYVCPPVGGGGSVQCDPYNYDCGDDDCINSSSTGYDGVQSCGGPGAGGGSPGGEAPIDGGSGGGGGGSGTAPPAPCPDYGCPPPEECDPQLDPECYKPLTGTDSATIRIALEKYIQPLSDIPDATARQECENMRNAFNTLYVNGRVFRGASTTITGDPGIVPHTGAYDPNTQKMHIDPAYLDAAATGDADAMRELADTMLHEAAHALMMQHPNGYVSTQWGPVFSDPYFNRLSPGVNSCIAW